VKFQALTLFPEMISRALEHGVTGQALRDGRFELSVVHLRDHAVGVHQAVDDRPFGGGDGMVMSAEVAGRALDALGFSIGKMGGESKDSGPLIYPSARGEPMTDALARQWAQESKLTFFCGRYGGVDQRLVEAYGMREVALGDYVLSGGEIQALAMIDAVARHLPGVLGNAASPENESFAAGLLEEPQFTRPREWHGLSVPAILLSGDHAKVAQWKLDLALLSTASARPDLLAPWCARMGSKPARQAIERALKRLRDASADELTACGVRSPEAARERLNLALERSEDRA
jgi:tRNA (guanine37-N1)-methyltransferase